MRAKRIPVHRQTPVRAKPILVQVKLTPVLERTLVHRLTPVRVKPTPAPERILVQAKRTLVHRLTLVQAKRIPVRVKPTPVPERTLAPEAKRLLRACLHLSLNRFLPSLFEVHPCFVLRPVLPITPY